MVQNPIIKLNDTVYIKTIFLADNTRNILMKIYPKSKIQFDKNSQNLLWMITNTNQIAVFKPEEFQKIRKDETAYIFDFSSLTASINNSNDFISIYKSFFKQE